MSQVTVPYSHVPLAVIVHSAKVRELFVRVEGTSQPAYYNLTGILTLWLGAKKGVFYRIGEQKGEAESVART